MIKVQSKKDSIDIDRIHHDKCRLCGSTDSDFLFLANVLPYHQGVFVTDKWPIVKCRKCGLVYQSTRPDNAAMSEYYRFENAGDQAFINDWFLRNSRSRYKDWERFLRIINKYQQGIELLDVGCGAGHFLDCAKNAGYSITGQEISPEFIHICNNLLDLNVLQGDLLSLDLSEASFDIITAFDVVEHLTNPLEVLKKIYFLLKSQGILIITTHNIGNFFAKLYGKHWRHIIPIGHLTYFTKSTLRRMVERAGFEVQLMGGGHTVDHSAFRRFINLIHGIFKYFIIRALVLGIYKPITKIIPGLSKWKINKKGKRLDHELLLTRTGNQIIINDDIFMLARKKDSMKTLINSKPEELPWDILET